MHNQLESSTLLSRRTIFQDYRWEFLRNLKIIGPKKERELERERTSPLKCPDEDDLKMEVKERAQLRMERKEKKMTTKRRRSRGGDQSRILDLEKRRQKERRKSLILVHRNREKLWDANHPLLQFLPPWLTFNHHFFVFIYTSNNKYLFLILYL